jgi:hypothetical protein
MGDCAAMEEGRIRAVLIVVIVLLFTASGVMLLRGCMEDDGFPDDIGGICRVVAERFDEIQQGPPLTDEEAAARVGELLETSTGADEALADLEGEAPDEASYATWLDARGEVTVRLDEAQAALEGGEITAYDQALRAANEDAAKRGRLAEAAGLAECARLAGRG